MTKLIFTLVTAILLSSALAQDKNSFLEPSRFFGSNMVLQCDKPITIWGEANAGREIEVILDGQVLNTKSGSDKKWSVQFPPRKASAKGISLKINDLTFTDILIGEVWFCTGQSNMVYSFGKAKGDTPVKSMENSNLRWMSHSSIRKVAPDGYKKNELERCNTKGFFKCSWNVSTEKSARSCSAVAWYFGQKLQTELKVPVGLVIAALGGSAVNNWISIPTLKSHKITKSYLEGDWLKNEHVSNAHRKRGKDAFKNILKTGESWRARQLPYQWMCEPGFIFDAIAQYKQAAFRGVLWYQGESDADTSRAVEEYASTFPIMINDWRQYFSNKDLPFIYVQLPGFIKNTWPRMREVQRQCESTLPSVYMSVSIDLGLEKNIHPSDKKPIGMRSSQLALKHIYGFKSLLGFPKLETALAVNDKIVLTFSECGDGFKEISGEIPGFEVLDKQGHFIPVTAQASRNSVTLSGNFKSPQKIRYAYQAFPEKTLKLYNSQGLPLGPFEVKIHSK